MKPHKPSSIALLTGLLALAAAPGIARAEGFIPRSLTVEFPMNGLTAKTEVCNTADVGLGYPIHCLLMIRGFIPDEDSKYAREVVTIQPDECASIGVETTEDYPFDDVSGIAACHRLEGTPAPAPAPSTEADKDAKLKAFAESAVDSLTSPEGE